ncbi:unnamed protein product [Brassicogethes aeneus]|uniref:Uncharacterized protein n=1 Tax=Brassicogethes aeneus TaxID=1431903 RepID=A0A9P0FFC0_BRAAE|nr:unnamed protein product [Brassicogethes aeneus]
MLPVRFINALCIVQLFYLFPRNDNKMKFCNDVSSDSVLSDNLYIELFEKKIRSDQKKQNKNLEAPTDLNLKPHKNCACAKVNLDEEFKSTINYNDLNSKPHKTCAVIKANLDEDFKSSIHHDDLDKDMDEVEAKNNGCWATKTIEKPKDEEKKFVQREPLIEKPCGEKVQAKEPLFEKNNKEKVKCKEKEAIVEKWDLKKEQTKNASMQCECHFPCDNELCKDCSKKQEEKKNDDDILFKNLTEETSCKDDQIFNEIIRNEKIKFINYCRQMKANYMKSYRKKSKERDNVILCSCQCCETNPTKKPSRLNCPPPPPLPCSCKCCSSPKRVPTCRNLCRVPPKQKQSCSTYCACCSPRKSVSFSPRYDCGTSCKCVQTVDLNASDYQCSCGECCRNRQTQGSDEESDDSYDPELYNLPYQNNDDYIDLIEELEEKLVKRNRNRVRRTMLEFENRSKQNKPLEKPILNHDEISESDEPILENLCEFKKRKQKTKTCPKTFKKPTCICASDRGDWEECFNENTDNNFVQSTATQNDPNKCSCMSRYSRSQKTKIKTKWKKNKKGEWCRVIENDEQPCCNCRNCCQQKITGCDFDSCDQYNY